MVPVCQRFAILNDYAAILPVCEVIFGKISACQKYIVVENMRFHVMHSEYFSERRVRKLSLQEPGVRVMVKPNSDWPIEVI